LKMRDFTSFFVKLYWEDAFDTLLGSVIVFLISLFFANFEKILPLYDPLATTAIPNGHPGVMGLFQILLWPALVSTAASLLTSAIRVVSKMRGSMGKPKSPKQTGTQDRGI
jgi:hypothetical protein